jgi:hypothetical protein
MAAVQTPRCHPIRAQLLAAVQTSLCFAILLLQRIVANLQVEVAARGLQLPEQLTAHGGDGSNGDSGVAVPLSMLLGGSLVDRMDILGRTGGLRIRTAWLATLLPAPDHLRCRCDSGFAAYTCWKGLGAASHVGALCVSLSFSAALHVASATGRADIVRQLVAAGASATKALPMDYRTLLRQHPDLEAGLEQQEQGPEAQTAGTDGRGCRSPEGCASGVNCSMCGSSAAGWGGSLPCDSEQVPAPKRGRYVTAGPHEMGAPSLQYCAPLHLAALYGQLEVVAALLSTGQVWNRVQAALLLACLPACLTAVWIGAAIVPVYLPAL